MGFYTKFGDTLGKYNVEQKIIKGDFNAKFAGGYDLYKWCYDNKIKTVKLESYEDDCFAFNNTIFSLTKSEIEKAIKVEAMGENNSKTVLVRLLNEMIENKLEVIYFEGDF